MAKILEEREKSQVEAQPKAKNPKTKRALGKMEEDPTVTGARPSPLEKSGTKSTGGVGMRAAPKENPLNPKAVEHKQSIRDKLRQDRSEHRQGVWDKLDRAKQKADDKAPRLKRFEPPRRK